MVCAVNIINLKGDPQPYLMVSGPCSAATLPALKLDLHRPTLHEPYMDRPT